MIEIIIMLLILLVMIILMLTMTIMTTVMIIIMINIGVSKAGLSVVRISGLGEKVRNSVESRPKASVREPECSDVARRNTFCQLHVSPSQAGKQAIKLRKQ